MTDNIAVLDWLYPAQYLAWPEGAVAHNDSQGVQRSQDCYMVPRLSVFWSFALFTEEWV